MRVTSLTLPSASRDGFLSPCLWGRGCRTFREVEDSALPQITNGAAIDSAAGTIIGSPPQPSRQAIATPYRGDAP
jgi:hypothetical protein